MPIPKPQPASGGRATGLAMRMIRGGLSRAAVIDPQERGEQLLGRRLGERSAQQTLKNLGIDDSGVSRLSSRELFAAVQSGQKAVLSSGWEIVAAMSYEQRIEVRRGSPFSAAEIGILKEQGAFVERINWSQRVFLPVGEDGLAVVERVIASKPVVDLFGRRSPDAAVGAGHQGQDAVQERRLPSSFTADQQHFAAGSQASGPAASTPASVTTARGVPGPHRAPTPSESPPG